MSLRFVLVKLLFALRIWFALALKGSGEWNGDECSRDCECGWRCDRKGDRMRGVSGDRGVKKRGDAVNDRLDSDADAATGDTAGAGTGADADNGDIRGAANIAELELELELVLEVKPDLDTG